MISLNFFFSPLKQRARKKKEKKYKIYLTTLPNEYPLQRINSNHKTRKQINSNKTKVSIPVYVLNVDVYIFIIYLQDLIFQLLSICICFIVNHIFLQGLF